MKTLIHKNIEASWGQMTLMEQLGNIGSEVSRASKWKGRDEKIFQNAVDRALELFDLTLDDGRWKGRRWEIARAREVFVDAVFEGKEYKSTFKDLNKYFLGFAYASAFNKSNYGN